MVEHQIISRLLNTKQRIDLRVPPGDDCAVLPNGLTLTTDTMVEGVHFDDRLSPKDIGYKCVAVSVSDIIAMGARPIWALLSLSIPPERASTWLNAFAEGLHDALNTFEVALIGGDTTRSNGPSVISTTLGGKAPASPLTRDGATAGDVVWVTGWPGLAGAGYTLETPPQSALHALRRPEPPVNFARALVERNLATAGMDLSDGIASDLQRLTKASNVGAKLHTKSIPAHKDIQQLANLRALQLNAGDDFQLIFTTTPDVIDEVIGMANHHNTKVTAIGSITLETKLLLDDGAWPSSPFQHFAEAI